MIVHTIRRGQFLRSLRPPGDSCVPAQISQLQVGMEGHIVVQTSLEERSHREVQQYTPKMYCHGHINTQSYKVSQHVYYKILLFVSLQGKYSIHVYSVNGCLLSSFTTAEQVTALHLVSEYIILGTMLGSLHIRDLYRCRNCSLQNKPKKMSSSVLTFLF